MTDLVRYKNPKPCFSLLRDMYVERGTSKDWDLLHELHYKTEGAVFGPNYYRVGLNDETIGVLVLGMPRGLLKDRHKAFPNLKPDGKDTKATNTWRYKWINANIRVVSRVVIDTMFRGVGVSYRFQNIVARMSGFKFIEIQSSMSKYNMFAQRAGFRFVKPSRSAKYEVGLEFFRRHFDSNPSDTQAMTAEYLAHSDKPALVDAMREFYWRHSALEKTGSNAEGGRERVAAMGFDALLTNIQQMTLASPMYGVYANPNHKIPLPERVPLLAFDNQDTKKAILL